LHYCTLALFSTVRRSRYERSQPLRPTHCPSRAIHGQGIALNTISQQFAGFHGGGTGDTTLDMHVLNVGLRVSW
jgi:hypothetical protein